jgi:hypothetical protein
MMSLSDGRYTVAAWVGVAVLAVALVYVATIGHWFGAVLLTVFLAASVVFVVSKPLPSLFSLLFVAAAVVNAAGWVWNLYPIVGYDEIAHGFTSFAVPLSLGFLVYRRVREPFREHRLHFVLVVTSFGITLGAFWGIFEWALLAPLPNPSKTSSWTASALSLRACSPPGRWAWSRRGVMRQARHPDRDPAHG